MNNTLALSGGGDKGSFTVGVIKRLLENGHNFDAISGTSTGALIAPLVSIPGGISLLERIYTTVSRDDIFTPDTPIRNFMSGYLYNTTPLWKLIKKTYTNDLCDLVLRSDTELSLATVSLNNERLTFFTNKITYNTKNYDCITMKTPDDLRKAIYASASQPVIMPTVNIRGHQYVDGGLKDYLPIDILIDNGAHRIFAILTTPDNERYFKPSDSNIVNTLLTTLNIFAHDVAENDVKLARLYNDTFKYLNNVKDSIQRITGIDPDLLLSVFENNGNPFKNKITLDLNIIRPAKDLGPGLNFDTVQMNEMFKYGYNFINLIK